MRRGGRKSSENVIPDQGQAKRAIPQYALLDDASLSAIERQADWILANIGMEFRGDTEAVRLFKEAGADVTEERVRLEPGMVRELCATAPNSFQLVARDPKNTLTVGGDNLVFMPGYGSPFVTDLENGRRYATLEDFQNFVKLSYATPHLNHTGGVIVEPTDVAVNKRHLDMTYAHLTLTTKPFMGAVTAPDRAHDSIEMARMVFGADVVASNAVMQGNININSPLVFDETMSTALRIYAAEGQCVCVSPAIFAGAMGPLLPAAVAAQTLAEGMVGIALAQLVKLGTPCVFGSFHSTMNLRSGALTFGSPEANLTTMALSQLGRRLGVPTRSGGGQITASNAPDAQAMADSVAAMWSTVLSGANQVWHAAGWLEGGLTMSYEKFILDLDQCGAMLKMLGGFSVDKENFGRDAYDETEPGENFLMTGHTLRHYATSNYEPSIPEAGPFETWRENGAPDAATRASAVWKKHLAEYERPEIDPALDSALLEFVQQKKEATPDQWY